MQNILFTPLEKKVEQKNLAEKILAYKIPRLPMSVHKKISAQSVQPLNLYECLVLLYR